MDGSQGLRGVTPLWNPRSLEEDTLARRAALGRLGAIAQAGEPDHEALLFNATSDAIPFLQRADLVQDVGGLVDATVRAYPGSREPLRSKVAIHLEVEAQRRDRDPAFSAALQGLHDSIADRSFGGRLRQHARRPRLGFLPPPSSLGDLVDEIIEQPGLLAPEWDWLTSGDANNSMELGTTLGRRDIDGVILSTLENLEAQGADHRFLAAYLKAHSEHRPAGWQDDWLEERSSGSSADSALVLDVTRLVGESTARSARRILRMLQEGHLAPTDFNWLRFGRWGPGLPPVEFRELIDAFAMYTELRSTALFLTFCRLQARPEEIKMLEATVLPLVTDPGLLQTEQLPVWQSVARLLAPGHPREIARTLFAAQYHRPGIWFSGESPAESTSDEIVVACIAADPEGVWAELSRFLEAPEARPGFVMNLPIGLADRFPRERVLTWAAMAPERLVVLARLAAPNFQDDQSLAAILADLHGDRGDVSDRLFNHLIEGSSEWPWSRRWAEHAASLAQIARTTRRDGLCRWATNASKACRAQETIARLQEEEARFDG
jgi:hypothetical protein